MAGSDSRPAAADSPADERQLELDEALGSADSDQCEAYADSTGERCQHPAVAPTPYCDDHFHLLDEVDMKRIGLKPSNSEG